MILLERAGRTDLDLAVTALDGAHVEAREEAEWASRDGDTWGDTALAAPYERLTFSLTPGARTIAADQQQSRVSVAKALAVCLALRLQSAADLAPW